MANELKNIKEIISARVEQEQETKIKTSTSGDTTENSITGINELVGGEVQRFKDIAKQLKFELRCCCPAIIKSINYDECTVIVQPVIKEKIQYGTQELKEMQLPEIQDVPLIYPSSQNGFSITFPVQINDECLLFFADTCIDAWWQSGGIQSQFEERRHDLSDCFCMPCQMSLPFKNKVNLNALEINFNGDINITATGNLNLKGKIINLN